MDLPANLEGDAVARGQRRRRPFADTVHRQDSRLIEWRGKKCARCMTQMMLGEQQAFAYVLARSQRTKLFRNEIFEKQLLPEPHRHRHAKRLEAARRKR